MSFQSLRRKSVAETVQILSSGPASIPLPPSITGITFRYVARQSPRGPKEFARHLAPQLAYANPHLHFTVERFLDPREGDTTRKGHSLPEKIKSSRTGIKEGSFEGNEIPPPELHIDLGSSRRAIDIRDKSALGILDAILAVAEGRQVAPAEALPRIGDGERDSTGTPEDASAENESMAGASAREELDAGLEEVELSVKEAEKELESNESQGEVSSVVNPAS
ncbi:hypothetical protein BCR39DRAFT_5921 [Naematelia encephala]|uniref:Ribosomal protein/NADH dehydrogenase domain-containing protein n=1 Tax=Naematelia encephala TaxID=71784 RepID=A0A1Y2BL86_9TREE|nr:hypothetical protein BCR39DRAFT_5921 [Naematelia encephala]